MVSYRRFISVLILALLLPGRGSSDDGGVISGRLLSALHGLRDDQPVPVIVVLKDRIDPFSARKASSTVGGMIQALRNSVTGSYRAIRNRVGKEWRDGPVTLLWINQTIALEATRPFVERLARDPGIELIDADGADFLAGDARRPSVESRGPAVLPWNITLTGVDSVWEAYGLDGTGMLIGTLDTGIDTSHPALRGKLRPYEAWKDFIFSEAVPYDNFGHGTFGSGILAGGNGTSGPGPGVGIAYGARLIVGKILDAGSSSIATVTSGMQWMLDPDENPYTDDFPQVVNNSWYSGTRGSTYAFAAAEAWRAAGIIPVFCAGNSGPASGTTRSPADYKNCISVGGTDATDDRYNSTSVGPSPPDTAYFPADGRKPDFSAPGEGVYSSQQGGGYSYSSGTSWSAPHVAGVIALMLQANPTLDYGRIHAIIRESASDLGTAGYDHVFGYGRINAMGAVRGALRERVRVQADPLLRTTETGGTAFFDVVLAMRPDDTVMVSLSVSDTTEAAVDPASLRFTRADWDVPRRVHITGLDDDTADGDAGYSVRMVTSSSEALYDGIETAPLPAVNADDENAVAVTLAPGWNLVSVPTVELNPLREAVFPGSDPPAYAYSSGYVPRDTLHGGIGYWLRFDEAGGYRLLGGHTVAETVSVVPGWNLVGSISVPVPPSSITSDPPNLRTSQFYGYSAGYRAADTIMPGLGYWVKVAGEGVLILRADTSGTGSSAIRIVPGDERPPGGR